MKLVLCAIEPPLADAWETFCGELDFVTVHRGSILDVESDAVAIHWQPALSHPSRLANRGSRLRSARTARPAFPRRDRY